MSKKLVQACVLASRHPIYVQKKNRNRRCSISRDPSICVLKNSTGAVLILKIPYKSVL